MAYEFPVDVVKTTDKFSTELRQFDGISVDDIARLWKAYATQSAVVRDVVVSRLENLFWRIWGNATIQQGLTGSVLATLFMAIHEDPSLHRTNHRPPSKVITSSTSNNVPEVQQDHNNSSPKNERKNTLPPILKKSDGTKSVPPSEPSSHKTTRILVPEKPSERPSQKVTKDTTSTENGKGNKSVTASSASATQKPIRKRPTFVANRAASSRRRGVLIRRKSSQTSPVTSPTVEETEDSLQEQIQAQEEARQEEQAEETTAPPSPAKETAISWLSMAYLKKFDEDTRNPPTEQEADTSGTSPPPTDFSISSVRHHRGPEEHFRAPASQDNAENGIVSDKSLVEQDFRTNFVQRQRQGSAFATRNNSAASSLTTRLSSTNFREMLNAAEATVAMQRKDSGGAARSVSPGPRYILLPKHDGSVSVSTMTSPTRKSDGRDRSRRPIIINTSSSSKAAQERRPDDKEPASNYPSAVAVSESVISTSQQTTTGVFSVPKESQELLGEQLTNLIKGKVKDNNKAKRGQRIGS